MSNDSKYILVSATRLSSYLQCKWKYWCNYELHLPRKPNISFKLGLAVHESLALAGEIWQKKGKLTKKDINDVIDKYNQVAAREGLADTVIYNDGLSMVNNRLKNFVNGTIVTIEEKFRVTTNDGVILIGAMDKVEELNEDTLLIIDYKTSKYFETMDELKADIQLSIYDAAASLKYPNYKRIILSLDYLRGEPVYTYRTLEERENFLKYLTAVYNEMLQLKKEDAKPMLNPMCNWCDFCDNCSAYQEAFSTKSFLKKKLDDYDNDELVKDYLDVKNRKRILDNKEREMRQFIMQKINATGVDIVGNGKHLYIRQNATVSYDPATVFNNVPIEEFLKMVSVSKKQLDEYLEKNPAARSKILESATKNYRAPFVAYRTIK